MKKLTNSVLVCSDELIHGTNICTEKVADTTAKTKDIGEVVITGALGLKRKQMPKLLLNRW